MPGCATQGETLEELLKNIYEAFEGYLSVDVQSGSKADTRNWNMRSISGKVLCKILENHG